MTVPTLTVRIDLNSDGDFTDTDEDVTSYVRSDSDIAWTRGRSADFSAEATGSASFTLRNDDGHFTTLIGNGSLVPGRPVHIYATYSGSDYPQFFGYVQRITPDAVAKTVAITCYDVLQRMAETDTVVPANSIVARCARDYRIEALSDFERGNWNLVTNGSFETDTSGWTTSGGSTLTRITGDHYVGAACGQWVSSSQFHWVAYAVRLVPTFFAGQVYRVSFWAKLSSGDGTCRADLFNDSAGAGSETHIVTRTLTFTGSWTRYTMTYALDQTTTASSTAPLTFRLYRAAATAGGTILIDGVQVTRGQADYLTTTEAGRWPNLCGNGGFDGGVLNGWHDAWANLCTNPSFESDTTGWSVAGDAFTSAATSITRSTSQAAVGTASGLVDVNAGGQGTFYALSGTFVSGVTYDVSLRFYAVTGSPTVTYGIGSQGTPSDKSESSATASSSAWTTRTFTWTPSSNRTDAHVYAKTAITLGDFYLDAVSVTRRSSSATSGPAYSDTGPGGGGVPPTSSAIGATAKYGASSQSVVAPATAGAGRIYDFSHFGSYFISGRSYTLSVWLYCSGSLPYKVGIGRNKADGSWDEASTTGTASAATWTQATVTWTPTADGSSAVAFDTVLYVWQTDATSRTFYIDGVRVIPGNAADAFEMSQWNLAAGAECSDVYLTTTASGSCLQTLTTLNGLTLSRHWIVPAMASPWYAYTTRDRDSLATKSSAETYDDDVNAMDQAEIDRAQIINIQPVTSASGTDYYSDQTSINTYGLRPGNGISGGSFFPNRTIPDLVGAALLTNYSAPRARPSMTVVNRFPSQLQRDLDDLVTVTYARLGITAREYLILRAETRVSAGRNLWTTVYGLEEYAY